MCMVIHSSILVSPMQKTAWSSRPAWGAQSEILYENNTKQKHPTFLNKPFFTLCCACVGLSTTASTCPQAVRRQLAGVHSLLSPCESPGSNSDSQVS